MWVENTGMVLKNSSQVLFSFLWYLNIGGKYSNP